MALCCGCSGRHFHECMGDCGRAALEKRVAELEAALATYVEDSILKCAELGFSCGSCGNEKCAVLAQQKLLKDGA